MDSTATFDQKPTRPVNTAFRFSRLPMELQARALRHVGMKDSFKLMTTSRLTRELVKTFGPFPNVVDLQIRLNSVEYADNMPHIYGQNYTLAITSKTSEEGLDQEKIFIVGHSLRETHSGHSFFFHYHHLPHLFRLLPIINHFRIEMGGLSDETIYAQWNNLLLFEYHLANEFVDTTEEINLDFTVCVDFSKCIRRNRHIQHCSIIVESFHLFKRFLELSDRFYITNGHFYFGNDFQESDETFTLAKYPQLRSLQKVELFSPPDFALNLFYDLNPNSLSLNIQTEDLFQRTLEKFIKDFSSRANFAGCLVLRLNGTVNKKYLIQDLLKKQGELELIDSASEFKKYRKLLNQSTYGQIEYDSQGEYLNLSQLEPKWREEPFTEMMPGNECAPQYAARTPIAYRKRFGTQQECVYLFFDYFEQRFYAGCLLFMMGVFDS